MAKPFYDDEPHGAAKKKADKPALPTPELGDDVPDIVPANPAKTSAFGGPEHAGGHRPGSGTGKGVIRELGGVRLSGHPGAHRLGKRGI
jgi:hypothetical protein